MLAKLQQEDFEISGVVENVSYNAVAEMPCEVAMGKENEDTGEYEYFAYESRSLAMCQFAERSKLQRVNVRLYGAKIQNSNLIFRMEFANTKSTLEFKMPKLQFGAREQGQAGAMGEEESEDTYSNPEAMHSMYS